MALPAPISREYELGGTREKPYGVCSYEIPNASVATLRPLWTPQLSVPDGGKTASGSSEGTTLTVSSAFFSDTATDAGKTVTIWGIGTYTIDTVTSTTVVEVTEAFGSTFSGKSFSMTGAAVWPADTGVYARRLHRFRERPAPQKTSMTLVKTWYTVPDSRRLLLEDTTKATIRLAAGGQAARLLKERTGSERVIEGPDPAQKENRVEWHPISGAPNQVYDPLVRWVVSYAASSISLSTLIATMGTTNDDTLSNFGSAAKLA